MPGYYTNYAVCTMYTNLHDSRSINMTRAFNRLIGISNPNVYQTINHQHLLLLIRSEISGCVVHKIQIPRLQVPSSQTQVLKLC